MRLSRWDVPFADQRPLDLMLSPVRLDQHGWWVDVEARGANPGKWLVHFSQILGFKYSNESWFDWHKWGDRAEAAHQAAAYIVEDGGWRDEFWNGRTGQAAHYAIVSGDCLLECLADQVQVFPSGYDPEVEWARRAGLSRQPRNP